MSAETSNTVGCLRIAAAGTWFDNTWQGSVTIHMCPLAYLHVLLVQITQVWSWP